MKTSRSGFHLNRGPTFRFRSGLCFVPDEPTPLPGQEYEPAPIIRPLSVKYYLELPAPSIDDCLSDLERVYRALRKKLPEFPYVHAHFSCLWGLAGLLRANDWKITATVSLGDADSPTIREIEGGDTTSANMGVAIDVGTTTIAAQLIDLRTGEVLGAQASHNSQARYGEDVVSRMILARPDGPCPPDRCGHFYYQLAH